MSDIHRRSASASLPDAAELLVSLQPVGECPDFWDAVRAAPHVSLFLDYDGTLAPFHANRMHAAPLPGTTEAIRAIQTNGFADVALVSGRPIAELLELIGDLGVVMIGSHGYEAYLPDGSAEVITITPEQASILDAAYQEALAIFHPDRVERKAASVAAHFRGLNPLDVADVEQTIERSWRRADVSELVEFRPFNGGLELRASGRTKGTAIEELLELAPPGTLPVYIGDDDTDEDAFKVLVDRGIGLKVGPIDAVTLAAGRLPNCAAVRQLLLDWPAARMIG